MKSIQLAWHPGTARFEATGHSGSRITFEAPGEPGTVPSTTVRTDRRPARAPPSCCWSRAPAAPPGTWSRSCASSARTWPRSTSPWTGIATRRTVDVSARRAALHGPRPGPGPPARGTGGGASPWSGPAPCSPRSERPRRSRIRPWSKRICRSTAKTDPCRGHAVLAIHAAGVTRDPARAMPSGSTSGEQPEPNPARDRFRAPGPVHLHRRWWCSLWALLVGLLAIRSRPAPRES